MSEPLRVALVHPYSWPEVRRGGERYLADLAWYLDRAGHEVAVVTGTTGQPGTRYDDGVRYFRYKHHLPHRLGAVSRGSCRTCTNEGISPCLL